MELLLLMNLLSFKIKSWERAAVPQLLPRRSVSPNLYKSGGFPEIQRSSAWPKATELDMYVIICLQGKNLISGETRRMSL